MMIQGYKIRRDERNKLLQDTDKYFVLDFPISDEQREIIKIYRQQLRNIPDNNFELPEIPDFIK